VLEVRRPYLARMLGQHDLEAVEHALIDAQMLPALGFWLIAKPAARVSGCTETRPVSPCRP
jgi:hypothetical protein